METMEKVVSEFICNLRGKNGTQVLRTVRGDTARMLRVRLAEGEKIYEITPDCRAVLLGRKADGSALYNSCRIEKGAIEYDFTPLTCSTEGLVHLQIRLYGGDQKILTTVPIRMEVFGTAHDAREAARCQDEQTALDQLVNDTRSLQLDLERDLQEGRFLGKSAYELARDRGYTGTEEQWLQSLAYDHSEEFTALSRKTETAAREAENARRRAEGHELGAYDNSRSAYLSEMMAKKYAGQAKEAVTGKLSRIPIRQAAGPVLTLKPWEFYSLGEAESLDLTLEPEQEGYLDAYGFRFRAAPGFQQLKLEIPWSGDHQVEPGKLHTVWILAGVGYMKKV